MPTLASFARTLTHEQDKLVKMGTIKDTRDQALAMVVLNASKGKQKENNLKQLEMGKPNRPKNSDGGSNPPKDKDKKGKEKNKCTYFHKVWHLESSCMKKTIDQMEQILEKNSIPVLDGTRKKYGTSSSDNTKKCHALVEGTSNSSTFIIDSGESRHMVSTRELFPSMHLNSGPVF